MNNVIEFKKDCIMKTRVAEITDITATHDYKILDDLIEGYFDVSGEYKITAAGLQKEEFMFTIPFSIALSSLIDKSTINLELKDFSYEIEKDILHLKMILNMNYEEIHEIVSETKEEEEETMTSVDELLESLKETNTQETESSSELMMDDNIDVKEDIKEEVNNDINEINENEKIEAQTSIKNIISSMTDEESFYKYKVYIMREEDTIESIAIKYNVTLDDLREYNDLESLNIGDKIVIPFININKDEN